MDIYAAGQSYEVDLLVQARKHARFYQWVAGASIALAVAFGLGLAFVASQHTVSAHVVRIDKSSGAADVLSITDLRTIDSQGLEAMATVRRYVMARERYNYSILQVDYNDVVNMSDNAIATTYDDEVRARMQRLGPGTEEKVEILTVTLPPDQVGRAVVRFSRTTIQNNQRESATTRTWQATLAYKFTPSPIGRRESLLINPLGFKVGAYVVEQELGSK